MVQVPRQLLYIHIINCTELVSKKPPGSRRLFAYVQIVFTNYSKKIPATQQVFKQTI